MSTKRHDRKKYWFELPSVRELHIAHITCNVQVIKLTGKKPGGIGPPGMPSLGGICPSGLGAGPAFCNEPKRTDPVTCYSHSNIKFQD